MVTVTLTATARHAATVRICRRTGFRAVVWGCTRFGCILMAAAGAAMRAIGAVTFVPVAGGHGQRSC